MRTTRPTPSVPAVSSSCPACRWSTRTGRDKRTGATGLEPATSGVTGRRSNQLNYAPRARPSVASASQPYPALARVIAGQKLDGITGRALGDLGQAQLPQERHAVRVDVLAGDEAVLDRDHVHAPVLDLAAGRLYLRSRPGHLALPPA